MSTSVKDDLLCFEEGKTQNALLNSVVVKSVAPKPANEKALPQNLPALPLADKAKKASVGGWVASSPASASVEVALWPPDDSGSLGEFKFNGRKRVPEEIGTGGSPARSAVSFALTEKSSRTKASNDSAPRSKDSWGKV